MKYNEPFKREKYHEGTLTPDQPYRSAQAAKEAFLSGTPFWLVNSITSWLIVANSMANRIMVDRDDINPEKIHESILLIIDRPYTHIDLKNTDDVNVTHLNECDFK